AGNLTHRYDTNPAQRISTAQCRPLRGRDHHTARGGGFRGGAVTARRLWGIGSPRTLRAHWMLLELGLEYETRAVIPRSAEMDDPELERWTKRHKIPFLEDGEIRIGESGAITLYLADRYRERVRLSPEPG